MNTYAVYFKPRGALASWPLASDTLFGAVCWGMRMLGLMDDEHLTAWLDSHRDDPPFAFSHAFPAYLNGKTPLRLYPRPATFQPAFADFNALALEWQKQKGGTLKAAKAKLAEAGKFFKWLDYVTEGVLAEITAGRLKPVDGLQAMLFDTGAVTAKTHTLCTKSEAKQLPEQLFQSEAMQHNQIDRMAGATVEGALYYRDEVFFAPGSGLWALLRSEPADFEQYIHPSLRYLADTGFGADRTSGKGHFEIDVQPAPPLPQAATPNAMMTLSHYLPISGEFDPQAEPLAYALKTLRPKREQKYPRPLPPGQKTPPIYKQAVRVFEPGSVFPLKSQKPVYGRLARLTPQTQEAVYQSGAALMLYL
jgi:CRISPR-associated protein Csm4